MEPLSETHWDVVINGTGLQQSLLALALSKSKKKVLHVDRNDYYGASEAAFSLQESEEWVKKINEGNYGLFSNAAISQPKDEETPDSSKLAFSRAYNLSLSPQIIYTRSKLLSKLVSSKVYKHLEFQAVGSWWIYSDPPGNLSRMPNGREDVFADTSIDNRTKRSLMKFLKFVVDYEEQREIWEPHAHQTLSDFLSEQFKLPERLRVMMLALTLSLNVPAATNVAFGLPRIARHLTSIGVFGPGFGSVYPKWGGGAEMAQVACRAGAVGGGVYVLESGIRASEPQPRGDVHVELGNGEAIKTRMIVSSVDEDDQGNPSRIEGKTVHRRISIIASPLSSLFQSTVEGSPPAAVSIVVFPSDTLSVDSEAQQYPVYIIAHSSDTGECPKGQTILYATTANPTPSAPSHLTTAIATLLSTSSPAPLPPSNTTDPQAPPLQSSSHSPTKILYSLSYSQVSSTTEDGPGNWYSEESKTFRFPGFSVDLAFGDEVVERVEMAWRAVLGAGGDGGGGEGEETGEGEGGEEGFLEFVERNVDDGDDEDRF